MVDDFLTQRISHSVDAVVIGGTTPTATIGTSSSQILTILNDDGELCCTTDTDLTTS